MLKVGLTGNIGSGKTMVAGIFRTLGIPVFYADTEAKKLYEDESFRKKLLEIFGPGIFSTEGEVLRPVLADIVFNNPSLLDELNSIIHPAVRKDYLHWLTLHAEAPYTLYEAAILFESGYYRELDSVICVTAPKGLRVNRVMKRDGLSQAEVEKRMSNQWDEERKVTLSDFIIKNDESGSLIEQVLEIHKMIVQSTKFKVQK